MLKQFQNPNRVKIKAPNWQRNLNICFLLGAAMLAAHLIEPQQNAQQICNGLPGKEYISHVKIIARIFPPALQNVFELNY